MGINMRHIFYNINNIEDKTSFLEDCISKSFKVKCDELDCSKSWSRTNSEKTYQEVLEMISTACFLHYVFILRDSIIPLDIDEFGEKYIEAGVRLNSTPYDKDYFLFIYINTKHLDYFIEKYDLKEYSNE